MDYAILVSLLWDLATGVILVLVAYGAWLCLEHRFAAGDVEESRSQAPTQSIPHSFS